MIENIEGVCLDLQSNAFTEIKLPPQCHIHLVKREATLSNIALQVCNSERSRNHRHEFDRSCRSSVEDRVDGPVAKDFVADAIPYRPRQLVRGESGELMTDVEVRRFEIESSHYHAPSGILDHVVHRTRPRV